MSSACVSIAVLPFAGSESAVLRFSSLMDQKVDENSKKRHTKTIQRSKIRMQVAMTACRPSHWGILLLLLLSRRDLIFIYFCSSQMVGERV